jgi:YVTN family beta-propeller protein
VTFDSWNDYVYVMNTDSDNVSVINGTKLVGTVAVGGAPEESVFDSQNDCVYVASFSSDSVFVINGTTLVGTIAVGSSPYSPAYDSENGYIYVPNYGSTTVSVINGTTVIKTLTVGTYPYSATYDSGNGYLYVMNWGSSDVSVINGTRVVATVDVWNNPTYATYDRGNGYVYVTNFDSNNVSVINGTKLTGSVAVGAQPYDPTYDRRDGYVYVPNFASDNVSIINGTTIVGSVGTGSGPYSATYDGWNGYVYLPNWEAGEVTVVDGTTVVTSVPVGNDPTYAAYDTANGYVYVANYNSDNVSVINGTPAYGWIVGTVVPSTATVTINGNATMVTAGSFNQSLSAGTYVVRATLFGYSVFQTTVLLTPGGERTLSISLTNRGWITGTVSPVMANVDVDLAPVTVVDGAFNISELGSNVGLHHDFFNYTLSAEATGYITQTILVVVTPGNVTPVAFVLVAKSPPTYTVTFVESGLPSGTNWSVTLDGTKWATALFVIMFSEPNGAYPYTVGLVTGYASTPSSGSVTVSGANTGVLVNFTPLRTVTFTESGLPSRSNWSVALNGTVRSSSSAAIAFSEPPGKYPYAVTPATGYAVNGSRTGNVTVNGKNVSVSVVFRSTTPPTYDLTFEESGLPAGTNWSVTLTAASPGLTIEVLPSLARWSHGATMIVFNVSVGNYTYSVASLTYQAAPGTVSVSGTASSKVSVAFTPIVLVPRSNTTGFVLPGWALGLGIAFVAIGASGLGLTLYRYRAREKERGRVAVAQISDAVWELDEHGELSPRTNR